MYSSVNAGMCVVCLRGPAANFTPNSFFVTILTEPNPDDVFVDVVLVDERLRSSEAYT